MSRRALLGGLGALGLSTYVGGSRAAAEAPPRRFIVVHVPEGLWTEAKPLRPVPGGSTLGELLTPLERHRRHVTVLNNLNMPSRAFGPGLDGHPRAVVHMLTATEMQNETMAGGNSVDQRIASAIGTGTRFTSLQFATRIVYGGLEARPFWSAKGHALPALQDPWSAYNLIFSGVHNSTAPKPALDLRRSALDHAVAEIGSLRARLSTGDRDRLDAYHQSLRDIERRLALATPTTCLKPTQGSPIDVKAEANYPKIGKLQMDLMVAALRCGLTRVASLQWGNSNDQCSYSWLGINQLGHNLAHNAGNCDPGGAKRLRRYRWYAEQLAYLVDQLAAIPEGEGTMLDNTVVLMVQEFGNANDHTANGLMWTLVGNAGGALRAGQVLDCAGRSVNDLHISLLRAFGIADQTFGNPKYCTGPLPGLV